MSGLRGSVTPTGKRTFDYPLSVAQAAQQQQQLSAAAQSGNATLSTPIHIQPRASPRSTSSVAMTNAGMNMAQSCPTFSWQPPPAPHARPRLASIDPPPMELPPSPPVFSPLQVEAVKGKKEEPTSVSLKKQIYSRSLSNYSSSAPTHVDYLSKFHPNLGQLDEAAGLDDSDEEEEEVSTTIYKPSARTMQTGPREVDLDEVDEPMHAGGIGIGQGFARPQQVARVQQVQRGDDFSLSKSPTIFSILSTSQQQGAPLGLHTADTSTSSSGSGSPGHSILGSIAAGADIKSRRSLTSHKPPMATSPKHQQESDAAGEDDLQFSISLTDEQDGEAEDTSKQQDFMPLY